MKGLFSLVVLANAALIFWVELLFGKKLLPALGGSPAVWNTCLMFYQVVLLVGYAYVLLLDRLRPARQLALHAAVLALAVIAVPWSLFLWGSPGEQAPVLWLLGLLTVSVGPSFFALSAGAPLLQRWFSWSEHGERGDPYFLYSASNLGSFLALGAYPFVIEPFLTLDQQAVVWKASFVGVALLVVACGVAMRGGAAGAPIAADSAALLPSEPLSAERRLTWTVLAFVPSSLLLGVTTHITSEISPVPLLWVVPLGIYLLSFVVAFGPGRHPTRGERKLIGDAGVAGGSPPKGSGAGEGEGAAVGTGGNARARWVIWAAGGVALAVVGLGLSRGVPQELGWLLIAGDLGVLLVAGLLCHTRLARDRPSPGRLAEFYFWMALGGALGGVFNTLVAPLLFIDPLEYPLVLALFALVASWDSTRSTDRIRLSDLALGAIPGAIAFVISLLAPRWGIDPRVLLPVAGAACLAVAGRPVRFGLALAGLVLVGFTLPTRDGQVVHKERSFYGIHRVYWDGERLWLAHGTTVHGGQDVREPGIPLTYYHPDGPVGSLFREFYARGSDPGDARIAVVGLGTGSLIAYARPGQAWTFYELDPAVLGIAEDPVFFTFLRDALATHRTVIGDARVSLAKETALYDMIVVDAFSSDAIPVHLLTREAIELYVAHLRPGGWIAFHTSNRYADFSSVLANLARELGLKGYQGIDEAGDPAAGRDPSRWALLSGTPVSITDPRWRALPSSEGRAWTDAYSSIFEVLR